MINKNYLVTESSLLFNSILGGLSTHDVTSIQHDAILSNADKKDSNNVFLYCLSLENTLCKPLLLIIQTKVKYDDFLYTSTFYDII